MMAGYIILCRQISKAQTHAIVRIKIESISFKYSTKLIMYTPAGSQVSVFTQGDPIAEKVPVKAAALALRKISSSQERFGNDSTSSSENMDVNDPKAYHYRRELSLVDSPTPNSKH